MPYNGCVAPPDQSSLETLRRLMRHSANLDILRSLAVSMVLIDHLVRTLVVHSGLRNIAVIAFTSHIGHVGVLAFFVHTSLVLMYSLERMARSEDRVSLRFYVRRFFRIYPLSIFCIIVAVIFHVPANPLGGTRGFALPVVIANLLLVQNIITKTSVLGPLWSLPFEVQMYVVLPALYYLTLRRRAIAYLIGLLALFCVFGCLLFHATGHLSMAAYVPCFLSGVLCYSLRDHIRTSVSSALWPPFVLLLICGYCVTNMADDAKFWIGWIFCLSLGLAINFFHDSASKPINAVARRVALYSYGIYLTQVLVLYLVFVVFGVNNLVFGPLLSLVLIIAASVVTYHLIESPFMKLGKRLSIRSVRTSVLVPVEETREGS